MSTKFEGRSSYHDLIDDLVESPSSSSKSRTFSSLPSLLDRNNNPPIKMTNERRDRFHLTLPRSNSSLIMMSNDERRKEIDLIIKHLYDGKLMTTSNDDHPPSDRSEQAIHMSSKEPITTMTIKTDKENKNNISNIDLLSLDGDMTSLQRELYEKELDIIHLRKEIQELQHENKSLKSKTPPGFSNGYTNNNPDIEALRREKDILQHELRTSQELISKFQQQQQNIIISRSNKLDETTLHQKETLEKKLKTYEQQMRIIANENEKFKQTFHQTERVVTQLRRENEELQQKLTEAKKRNDELFYQEFHAIRNDLKMLKQRNNELFEENLRLQQKPTSDSKYLKIDRSDSRNISEASDSTNYLTTVSFENYNPRPSTSIHRSATINGNNHHRTIRYNSSIGQEEINGNNHHRTIRYNSSTGQEEIKRNKSKPIDQQFNIPSSKTKRAVAWDEDNIQLNEESLKYALVPYTDMTNYDDRHQVTDDIKPVSSHFHQSNHSLHRSATFNESQHYPRRTINNDTNNQHDDRRQTRRTTETVSPRRPYAPTSVNDVHIDDIIKFSRPGGKISKGIVKYIGSLPDKTDQYLGLELEDEESKHDGIYQDQRLFQCKPNKGVFVAFNKVIMAWSDK